MDIDEVKSWPAEKILRWSIALKVMSEEMNKACKVPRKSWKALICFQIIFIF